MQFSISDLIYCFMYKIGADGSTYNNVVSSALL